MMNERAEFERWFTSQYHTGDRPSGDSRDYSVQKDGQGRYLWLRAAVAWQAWRARSGMTPAVCGEPCDVLIGLGDMTAEEPNVERRRILGAAHDSLYMYDLFFDRFKNEVVKDGKTLGELMKEFRYEG
jgi:hypothetical protein